MDVSILIVNYNTRELTARCIDRVFEKTGGLSFEVLLIDNASQDGSSEQFRGDPRIRLIESPENLGFGRANNLGIEQAQGRNIFCLNPDTLLLNNAVKILSDYLDTHPRVGVCGGNLYDARERIIYSYHRVMPGLMTHELALLTLNLTKKMIPRLFYNTSRRPIRVGFVSGANMMTRAEILRRVGTFDPGFFMYSEETELEWRIRRAGYRVMNVPQARIIHLEGQSFTLKEARLLRMLESRRKFYRKTRSAAFCRTADFLLRHGVRWRIFIHTLLGQKEAAEYFRTYKRLMEQA